MIKISFVIRSFFFEKWLLTHVFGGSRGQKSSCKQACIGFLTFCPWYHYHIIEAHSRVNEKVIKDENPTNCKIKQFVGLFYCICNYNLKINVNTTL